MEKSEYIKQYKYLEKYLIKIKCYKDLLDDKEEPVILYYSRNKLYDNSIFLQDQYIFFKDIPDEINIQFSENQVLDFLYFIDKKYEVFDNDDNNNYDNEYFNSLISICMYLDISLENNNFMLYDIIMQELQNLIINNINNNIDIYTIIEKNPKFYIRELCSSYIKKQKLIASDTWIELKYFLDNIDTITKYCIDCIKVLIYSISIDNKIRKK